MDGKQWLKWLNDNINDVEAAPSAERKQKLDALFDHIIKRYAGQGLGALKADLDARDPELENLFPALVYRRRAVKTLEKVKSIASASSTTVLGHSNKFRTVTQSSTSSTISNASHFKSTDSSASQTSSSVTSITQRAPFLNASSTDSRITQPIHRNVDSEHATPNSSNTAEISLPPPPKQAQSNAQPPAASVSEPLDMSNLNAPLQIISDSYFLQQLMADHAALTGTELTEAQARLDLRSLNEKHWEAVKSYGYLEVFSALVYFLLLIENSPTEQDQKERLWSSIDKDSFLERLSEISLTSKLTVEVALAHSIIELLKPPVPTKAHPFVFSESFQVLTVRASVAIPVGDLYSVRFLNKLKTLKVEPGSDHDLSISLVVLLDSYDHRQLKDLDLNFDIDAPKGLQVRVALLGDWAKCHCQVLAVEGSAARFTIKPTSISTSNSAVPSSASNKDGNVRVRLINSEPPTGGTSGVQGDPTGLPDLNKAALVCGSGVAQGLSSQAKSWSDLVNHLIDTNQPEAATKIEGEIANDVNLRASALAKKLESKAIRGYARHTSISQRFFRPLRKDQNSMYGEYLKQANHLYTTNLDWLIDSYTDRETLSIKNQVDKHNEFSNNPRQFVVHLNGVYKPDAPANSFALTREEYHDPKLVTNFLRFMVQQVTERSLLFIGVCGLLLDPHWVLLWETLSGVVDRVIKPMFVLCTEQEEEGIARRCAAIKSLTDNRVIIQQNRFESQRIDPVC